MLARRRGDLSISSISSRLHNRFRPEALVYESVFWGAVVLMGLSGTGCAKKVKAEFKRPPATASSPPPEPAPESVEVEAAPVEPETGSAEPDEASPPEPTPPPSKPASKPEPVAEPAPLPAPPDTQLAEELGTLDPETRAKLERADSLLGAVDARPLSQEERQQAGSARAFVAQAKKAIREGDERRALVLLAKGLLLVEDLERSTRP